MKKFFSLLFVLFVYGAKAQIVNIPDANFKNRLLNYFPVIDTNTDGEIQVSEAAAVTDLQLVAQNISNLTGVEYFVNLTTLNISVNPLTSVNLSNLHFLYWLDCQQTQLVSLDLSGLASITRVDCSFNPQLSTINLTGLINLTDLFCNNNNITSLDVNNLSGLRNIACNGNALTTLTVNGLQNLVHLNCEDNNLNSLSISNCPLLSILRCGNAGGTYSNHFTSLDLSMGLPALSNFSCIHGNLTSLDLSGHTNLNSVTISLNPLTSLNVAGCTNLSGLDCSQNQLSTLDLSGLSNLYLLQCYQNVLTSINLNGCDALWRLNCVQNQLSTLDLTGKMALTQFAGNQNQLTNISGLQNLPALKQFTIDQNLFTSLDFSGCPLLDDIIDCRNNPLTYINLKNGNSNAIASLYVTGIPNLQYVCADEPEIAVLQNYFVQQGMANVNVNSYCSFVPGGSFNTINGVLKIDIDNNGCGPADPLMPQYLVKINDGTNIGYTSTNNLGAYSFFTNAGNFTITPQTQNPYFTVTPSSAVVNFSSAGGNIQIADFCILPNGVHNDIDVTLIPISRARPGFDATYKLVYTNKGTTTLSGNVELVFDDGKMNFIVSTPAVTTQATGLLSWAYSSLHPFETRSIDIQFNVLTPPVNNINDSLFFTCSITPLAADETPLDNSFEMEQLVTGSFDPNDKNCLEGDKIDITRVGDYVHYLVRFQNTGTDVAENVVITDILENNFNWNSLVIYQSSHPYKLKQSSGNKLEFIFEGINLPAVTVDEPGSHGFIAFKVRTAATLVLGDSVRNSAAIYFDFNLPVITNTTRSVIDSVKIIPVGIEYFKGVKQSDKNLLNWKVNCTSLQVKFNIERSTDGRNFTSLQSITASNTRCLQPFDFSDNNPASGMNYYRIKMTDIDGKITYSSVIALLNKKTGFEIVNLIPNPVTNETALLNITSAEKQTVTILVTDASGKMVHSTIQPVIAGFTQVKLNFNNLAIGVYTIAVYTNEGERKTLQFIKK